jgi:hypothetical protein
MTEKTFCAKINGKCPHKISKSKKTCFIMMAYEELNSKKIEKMLTLAVKKAIKVRPILSKSIKITGSCDLFCNRVCRPIREATYCISDLTYKNTNVGFEIGIAQKYDKPVIITKYVVKKVKIKTKEKTLLEKLKKNGAIQYTEMPVEIPADITAIHRIEYKSDLELRKKLKETFKVKK